MFSNRYMHYPAMDARKLKEGPLRRYKSSLFGSKWKPCHAILYSDSTFSWFDDKNDSKPAGSILLKDVVPYICVGQMTDRMPVRRPNLPGEGSVHHLVGIGMDPRAEKVYWFLFSTDSDLESWFNEIVKTLPKVEPPPNAPPPGGPTPNVGDSSYKPPPVYPPGPPQPGAYNPYPNQPPPYQNPQPNVAYGPGPGYGGYRQPYPQQPYPQQPQTVYVERDRPSSGVGGLGAGLLGFGGGMLAGSLLSHGVGSFFTPYYGGGWGGPGFGGGYYSDNDTTVVNNYYNNDDSGNAFASNPEPNAIDYDQGGGGDWGDSGGGWGDSGGDFGGGGGDFGGDFGGGDFGGDFGGGGDW